MQMVLLILEVFVYPIKTQEVECLTRNTATFFGIDNIINFAVGYTQISSAQAYLP